MAFDYDLFVIGGGSGGVRAGRVASQNGAKVALAEEFRMGGTCVIRGCVPKKLMVFASHFGAASADARAYGWDIPDGTFNWTPFRAKLHAELERLEAVYRRILGSNDVEIYDSRATVKDPHTVVLSDGREITAKHILVATGGHPVKPDVPGNELAITSNEIFLLDAMPKSILIVGGGYIASEFAGILNGLGIAVTQIYRGAQILRGFDDEARTMIADGMREKGVDLQVNTDLQEIAKTADGLQATFTDGSTATYDQIMYATGRRPNTDGLGLEAAGVALGFAGREDRVLMKLVVSKASRKVLGCHIVADGAGEMIQMAGIAVKMGATKEDFDRTVAVHPTMAEELVTMKEPVRST